MTDALRALVADLAELAADSKRTADDATDSGNKGQADYERGREHAFTFALNEINRLIESEESKA